MAGSYNTLEPKIEQQLGQLYPGGSVLGFNPSAKVDLYGTTSFLFVTAFMLIAVATGAELVISGARRLQASDAAIQKSREGAWRAVKGFVGVLSIFVLLYTANKGMLRGDVGLEELRSSVRKGTISTTQPTETTRPVTTNGTEKANRDALAAQGITVNKEACTAAQMQEAKPSCTNLANLDGAIMSMLIQLRDSCPGSTIVVTGGTEPGHKNHSNGRAVDLRIGDSKLDTCISKFVAGPSLNWCNRTYVGLGVTFCDEINSQEHWHVFK